MCFFVHKKHLFADASQLCHFCFFFVRTTCQDLASTCPGPHNLNGEKSSSSFRDTRKFDVLRYLLSCVLGLQLALHEHSLSTRRKLIFLSSAFSQGLPLWRPGPTIFLKKSCSKPHKEITNTKKSR